MTPIRVGVLGASADSGWARSGHIPAIAATPRFTLTAAATSNKESAVRAQRAFGTEHAFVGASELAASPDVDLLVVSLKSIHHIAAVEAVLDAGKAVWCEWPLGSGSAATRAICIAGVRHAAGSRAWRRHNS